MISTHALIKAAQRSKRPQQHAAIIMKGGAVLAVAHNQYKQHAEIRALKKIHPYGVPFNTWRFEAMNLTLFSIRINRRGELRNAKPCPDCRRVLYELGVRTLFYSSDDGTLVRERIRS